jgi:hypothetical protein
VSNLRCDLLTEGFAVDLRSREIRRPPSATAVPPPPAVGLGKSVHLLGSSDSDSQAGAVYLDNGASDDKGLQHGLLSVAVGRKELPLVLVGTNTFSLIGQIENRVGGLLWGLTSPDNPVGRVGLLLPAGAGLRATDGLTLAFAGEGGKTPDSAALLIDSRSATYRDRSTYVVEPSKSGLPRQSVALLGLRLHLLATSARIDLIGGQLTLPPP